MQIILVEDNFELAQTLQNKFKLTGNELEWVASFFHAKNILKEKNFDLAILDIDLSDGNGFDLTVPLKAKQTPFIFMSAFYSADYRLKGYELGALEFIPKPFLFQELMMRIENLQNKTHQKVNKTFFGSGYIDWSSMQIIYQNGARYFLSLKDFLVLKYLVEASPKVLSRDEILDYAWGIDQFPSQRTVDNSILRLRSALKDEASLHIKSIRGVGYQWINENLGENG